MNSMIINSASSGQPTELKLEPATLDKIASGEIRVHYQLSGACSCQMSDLSAATLDQG
jgi:hypothetical protein